MRFSINTLEPGGQNVALTRLKAAVTVLLCGGLIFPFVVPFWFIGFSWWPETADLAHFFAFGALAIALNYLFSTVLTSTLWRVLAVLTSIAIISIATEWVQWRMLEARSGNWKDVLHNFSGGLCSIGAWVFLNKTQALALRTLAAILVLVLLSYAAFPVVQQLQYDKLRQEALPTLFNFQNAWETKNILLTNVRAVPFEQVSQQAEFNKQTFEFDPNNWGIVRLNRVWSHWRGYSGLTIDLVADTSGEEVPVQIYITYVNDVWQLEPYWAISNAVLTDGLNSLKIPIDGLHSQEGTVNFQTAEIQFIDLIKWSEDASLSFSINAVTLWK
ncbi:MAG: VanZ family protein [Pseudomonadota bacterium]